MTNVAKVFVGVDVSKDWLDVHIHPLGKSLRIDNSLQGLTKLLQEISTETVEQIVCESSGGYENLLLNFFREKKYLVWQVDPKRIKAFRISEGMRTKTDPIDARMIALFAAQKKCKYVKPAKSETELKLAALVKRRADVTEIAANEKRHLKAPSGYYCRERIEKMICYLEAEITTLDAEIAEIIKNDSDLNNRSKIIESVPGVGKVTAASLLANMPELGTLENKQAAALLGVVPYTKQSGTYKGNEIIGGGRSVPRKALYMAALTASRCNAKMKEFYDRLRQAGKKPKVAIVAVMNKLIGIINAMLRDNTLWVNVEIRR